MSQTQTIGQVRKLIADADLKQALEVLVSFLEKEKGQFEDFTDSVIQLQAQYNRTKIDEVKGIISANEAQLKYNQINQKTLDLLELLDSGRSPKTTTNRIKQVLPYAIGVVILGIVVTLFFFYQNNGDPVTPDTPVNNTEFTCPTFDPDSAFKILLLPFRPLAGGLQNTHLAIQERFSDLQNQWKINADTEVLELDPADNKIYPGDYGEAANLGTGCRAQLIIWGTTEIPVTGNTITRTRYKFLESGERFSFKRLNIKEGSQIDTVTSLSQIAAQGIITEELENIMRLIFGLVAHEVNNSEAAIELLGDMKNVEEDTTLLIQQMALADSYLSTNRSDEALDSYNKVLEVHPDYGLALNNRGMLHLQKKAYAEATEDFSRNLALDSTNVDTKVLVARSEAYLKSEHLAKARTDLDKAAIMEPDDPVIREKLKEVDQKIDEQRSIKRKAESLKQAQRSITVNDEVEIALSSKRLGEYDQAITQAENVLKKSPKNTRAFAILMESYTAIGDTAKAKATWERARKAGIEEDKIRVWVPLSNSLFREKASKLRERKQ